ncbi:MAG: ABC transporter permease [Propionibacteriaceae bacterium]|jgi:peptide/nickel transport system permease protein|nr:ABC transporter permease [Propionibacteriaceae bacterium]
MKKFTVIAGSAMTALVLLAALVSFVWTPFDPSLVDSANRFAPLGWPHVLGTDAMGIDTASRLLVGARTVVFVGVVSVEGAAVVGIPLGLFAGMRHGWWGEAISRAGDILFALPALLLAILLAAAVGASVVTAMLAIAIATVPVFIRMARAATLTVMELDYIDAARVAGTSEPVIALRHVVPNIAPLIGVQAAVSFGMAILAEAGLSYLGLSASSSTPTWGRMMRDANLFTAPAQAVIPGCAIAFAVMGFNVLGDGLRDYLDPRLKEVR